jgi:orotate phosphoribosyltransferase
VLVVDDLIRSAETQELLVEVTDSAGGDVVGVFALIAVGDDGIERAREHTEAPWTRWSAGSDTVDLDAGTRTCPDHHQRNAKCKHLFAVELSLK